MKTPLLHSHIYVGDISHRRFSPKKHSFNYSLYMLALNVEDMEHQRRPSGIFGFSWFHPLRFVEKDYLKGEPDSLSNRIKNKVKQLNGDDDIANIVMLVQVRCFGLYFSPVNFYFCYNADGECQQMLAEVSNTPWNERHYYLVNVQGQSVNNKNFHVSPFMDLDMAYHWHIKPPQPTNDKLLVHIENRRKHDNQPKVFDATLAMSKQPFTRTSLFNVWINLPVMTVKVIGSIYWQALKLLLKKVPFIGYQKSQLPEK